MPELKYRQLVSLLRYFGTDLQGDGSPRLHVTSRAGKPRTVHCHPGHAFWPEALAPLLRHLGVSRDEFWDWWQGGQRPR